MLLTQLPRTSAPPSDPELLNVDYPETDGKPMGETDLHIRYMLDLRAVLEIHFEDDPDVYVSGNILMYYREGQNDQFVSPDVLVTRGLRKGMRDTYKIWVEGKAPDFVIEVSSRSTRERDTGAKRGLYEVLGVQEYFLYDPRHEYLDPQLQGLRLVDGIYRPITADAQGSLASEVLDLDLCLRNDELHLYDRENGKWLLTPAEAGRQLVDAERQLVDSERQRMDAERKLADAEVELARLRGLLEGRGNP